MKNKYNNYKCDIIKYVQNNINKSIEEIRKELRKTYTELSHEELINIILEGKVLSSEEIKDDDMER